MNINSGSNKSDKEWKNFKTNEDTDEKLSVSEEMHPENQPSIKGQQYISLKDHNCTDVFCLIIFSILLFIQLFIALLAYRNGDPRKLIKPTDYLGNICGYDEMEDKPYLLMFDITACARAGSNLLSNGCPTTQICIASCPNSTWTMVDAMAKNIVGYEDVIISKSKMICKYNENPMTSNQSIVDLVTSGNCAPYYTASRSVFGRCLPLNIVRNINDSIVGYTFVNNSLKVLQNNDILDGEKALISFMRSLSNAKSLFADIMACWEWIICLIALGALVSYLFCFFIKYISKIMVYLSLALFIGLFMFGGLFCFSQYASLKTRNQTLIIEIPFDEEFGDKLQIFWITMGSISITIALIVLILAICLRKELKKAIDILGNASKMISDMLSVLIFPLVSFIFYILVSIYCLSISLYLASMSRKLFVNNNFNSTSYNISMENCGYDIQDPESRDCLFSHYVPYFWIPYLQTFNIFMFLWLIGFIDAMGKLILAGAFSEWYWTDDKSKVRCCPVPKAMLTVISFHLGTAALGSFILAIVRFVRMSLVALYMKMISMNEDNCFKRFCMCICMCCCKCVSDCLRFMTKNAYIMTMMVGKSFFPAAQKANFLIMRNGPMLYVLNDKLADILLFLGRLIVCAMMAIISYVFFSNGLANLNENFEHNLNYTWVPVFMVILGTFITATIFFQVFEYATDVLLLCVLIDMEVNKDDALKFDRMPGKMKDILSEGDKNHSNKI